MEKLAVVIDDEKTKTADSTKGKCPKCGMKLPEQGEMSVPWCIQCGTEPFEKNPPKEM